MAVMYKENPDGTLDKTVLVSVSEDASGKLLELLNSEEYRRVGKTDLGDEYVSTVFLMMGGEGLYFETMVFDSSTNEGLYSRRYGTYLEAVKGHTETVIERTLMK